MLGISIMDVKDAIARARQYLWMVYSDERIDEARLEEVSFDRENQSWLITFGILRPCSNRSITAISPSPSKPILSKTEYVYKVVKIPDNDIDQPSMQIRETAGQ